MANAPKVYRKKISDFTPLKHNPNKGSERGQYMLEKSFEKGGAGRSGLLAANDVILAGNHASAEFGASVGEDVIVVETTGNEYVFVKRIDIPDEHDARAKALIIGDNRASDDHEYDNDILETVFPDLLDTFFFADEISPRLKHQRAYICPDCGCTFHVW